LLPYRQSIEADWPHFQASLNAGSVVKSSDLALNVEYWSLSSFAQWGIRPHFIILGIRFPSTDRIATSIGSVGGLFQSGAKFGAGAFGANFKRILISE
jgi:hypothetical protein